MIFNLTEKNDSTHVILSVIEGFLFNEMKFIDCTQNNRKTTINKKTQMYQFGKELHLNSINQPYSYRFLFMSKLLCIFASN